MVVDNAVHAWLQQCVTAKSLGDYYEFEADMQRVTNPETGQTENRPCQKRVKKYYDWDDTYKLSDLFNIFKSASRAGSHYTTVDLFLVDLMEGLADAEGFETDVPIRTLDKDDIDLTAARAVKMPTAEEAAKSLGKVVAGLDLASGGEWAKEHTTQHKRMRTAALSPNICVTDLLPKTDTFETLFGAKERVAMPTCK